MTEEEPKGLYPKYDVINRVSGELVTEPTFVLKPDKDPAAREALLRYARVVSLEGNQQLALDIVRWLKQYATGRALDLLNQLEGQITSGVTFQRIEDVRGQYRDPAEVPSEDVPYESLRELREQLKRGITMHHTTVTGRTPAVPHFILSADGRVLPYETYKEDPSETLRLPAGGSVADLDGSPLVDTYGEDPGDIPEPAPGLRHGDQNRCATCDERIVYHKFAEEPGMWLHKELRDYVRDHHATPGDLHG